LKIIQFPFGRGHPAEKRKNRVSVLECIKHYLSLGSRKFAQHHQFLAVAFDKISLGNMYMANYLQCKKNSNNKTQIAKVTNAELAHFLIDKTSSNKQCATVSNDGVNLMMKSITKIYILNSTYIIILFYIDVSSARSRIWGTNDERALCRDRAFAMQAFEGLPNIFCTITPDLNSHYLLSYYSGEMENIDLLNTASFKHLPKKTIQYQISSKNPYACAKLFDRFIALVIKILLGKVLYIIFT